MIDALVPPTLDRCARRLSTILILLGVLVLFLFPASAAAGAETPTDRWVTGGLLALAGALLRVLPPAALPLLAVHAVAQYLFGGVWAAVASLGMLAYAVVSLLRGRRERGADRGAPAEEPQLHSADVVRENVEAVVMALLIALTVREFLYEAFLIPTGSMQPTILGSAPREGRKHGDRLLATKVSLLANDPPRWSIVVFKFPLYRRVNYIKRLVGLPGERLEIRDGDIYVNGAVVAKPEDVQDQLWFPEFPFVGDVSVDAFWKVVDGAADWSLDADSITAAVAKGASSRVRYDQSLDRSDTDLKVGAHFDIREIDGDDGAALLRVDAGGRVVDLEIGLAGAWLSAPGLERTQLDGVTLPAGGARVDLGVADRVARVWLDGRLVARVPHDDIEQGTAADSPRVSLGLRSASARLSDLRVACDLQYEQSATWPKIPDDGFVMLGDNTRSSKDSREWHVLELTAADGSVYHTERDVKLEDGSIVSFRKDAADYVFIDVDGIARRIPVEGTEMRTGVPAPFVRRRDLIGRAFVIFFPFPPLGDFRLRFLP